MTAMTHCSQSQCYVAIWNDNLHFCTITFSYAALDVSRLVFEPQHAASRHNAY